VASYSSFIGVNDVSGMREAVADAPVAVALHASSDNFRYYRSGVVNSCCDKEEDPNCDDVTLDVNHGVTIFGYEVGTTEGKSFWKV